MQTTTMTLLALATLTLSFGWASCASGTGQACSRECAAGRKCVLVEDPAVPGTFLESCAPIASGSCTPACGSGEVCQSGHCVSACEPECDSWLTCDADTHQCGVHPLGIGCPQILDCQAACAGDTACEDECYGYANGPGKTTFNGLKTCLDANGCDDPTCAACSEPYAVCQGETPSLCDPACPSGYYCDGGACVPEGGPVCDPPCLPPKVCAGGICVDDIPTGCQGIPREGGCSNGVLRICRGGTYVEDDCGSQGCPCGWSQSRGHYACLCSGPNPSCNPPCPAGTVCVNGSCLPGG